MSTCEQGKVIGVQMLQGRGWEKAADVLGSGLKLLKSSCKTVSVPASSLNLNALSSYLSSTGNLKNYLEANMRRMVNFKIPCL